MRVELQQLLKRILEKVGIIDNKIEIVKLWENASVTSSFAAQTLDVTLTNYDMIMIIYREATTAPVYYNSGILTKIRSKIMMNTTHMSERAITSITNTGITFSDGYKITSYASGGSYDNTYIIPYQIYGIQGVRTINV